MAMGPLEQFVPPGTYVKTDVESPAASAAGNERFAALIGVGLEESRVDAFELVRGSSASSANIIIGEIADANGKGNLVDGVNVDFYTARYPLVQNDGVGSYVNNPSQVIVTVNSENVQVQKVEALTGKITLAVPPEAGDVVTLNYYFKRRDTFVENENLSLQADGSNKVFKVSSVSIVKGDNGGNYATKASVSASATTEINNTLVKVPVLQVLVNGQAVEVATINGGAATFTLVDAPALKSEVLVSYFKNDCANTGDILPAAKVTNIVRVGFDPGRADFIEGRDYVLSGDNVIHWGNAVTLESGESSVGTTPLNSENISVKMVDTRLYKVPLTAGDTSNSFVLPYTPVTGEGKGIALENSNGITDSAKDDITVYVGDDAATAVEAKITKISGNTVTLSTSPLSGSKVFASFYASKLLDDSWTITNKVPDKEGLGKYTVNGTAYGSARQVTWDASAPGTPTVVKFMDNADVCNASIPPSRVFAEETITVKVLDDKTFTVTSNKANATGSDSSSNNGVLGQTYIDKVTGFTFALSTETLKGTVTFLVKKTFTIPSSLTGELGIPGVEFIVSTTKGVSVSDTAIVKTFNMSSNEEPNIGDVYYVTFDKAKVDYSPKTFGGFDEFEAQYGSLAQDNPLAIGAYLYFLNGGTTLVVKQLKRANGSTDANVSDYIEAINTFDDPLSNGTRPCLISVLTTNPQVISYLKTSNAQQSSIRFRNERTSWCGYARGTTPETALAFAKGLSSELINMVYPDSAVMTIPDSDGKDQDILVSGEYIAAALTGQDVNPTYDVATPLTNTRVNGFKRLGRVLTQATANLVAQAGVTILEYRYGVLKTMMALTTDVTGPLTRDPRIIEVKHFVQRGVRVTCDPYIGKKNINGLTNDVRRSLLAYFTSLRSLNLISKFDGSISVTVDKNDPTIINVAARYVPVFGVNWIVVTHNLRSSL